MPPQSAAQQLLPPAVCCVCEGNKSGMAAYTSPEEVSKAISMLSGWGPPALGEE